MGRILKSEPAHQAGAKPRIVLGGHLIDRAGNIFIATNEYLERNQFNGEVHIYKVDPQGAFTEVAVRQTVRGKGDSCSIAQTGPHISVLATVHVGDPVSDLQMLDPVLDVAVPYPDGVAPRGADGAYLGGTEGEPVDYQRIQDMLDAHRAATVQDITNGFGGDIRRGIYDKCKQAVRDAMSDAGVSTVSNIRETLYQFTMDRMYQVFADNVPNFWEWLRNKVAGR